MCMNLNESRRAPAVERKAFFNSLLSSAKNPLILYIHIRLLSPPLISSPTCYDMLSPGSQCFESFDLSDLCINNMHSFINYNKQYKILPRELGPACLFMYFTIPSTKFIQQIKYYSYLMLLLACLSGATVI